MTYRHDRSIERNARAREVLPGGVSSNFRLNGVPVPLTFTKGEGCRLTDVDGNVYVDYALGMGANILGHAPAAVIDTSDQPVCALPAATLSISAPDVNFKYVLLACGPASAGAATVPLRDAITALAESVTMSGCADVPIPPATSSFKLPVWNVEVGDWVRLPLEISMVVVPLGLVMLPFSATEASEAMFSEAVALPKKLMLNGLSAFTEQIGRAHV